MFADSIFSELSETPENLLKIFRKSRDPEIKKKLMAFYINFVRGIVRKMGLSYAGALLGEEDLVNICKIMRNHINIYLLCIHP